MSKLRKTRVSKKSDEFIEYLGEFVTLYFKDPFVLSVSPQDGSTAVVPVAQGYVIDFTDHFVRIGETPHEYTRSIAIDKIDMIEVSIDTTEMVEIMPEGEIQH